MKPAGVLLRVLLTLLMVAAVLLVGIALAPRLARFGGRAAEMNAPAGGMKAGLPGRSTHPDWGGGRLSFRSGPAAGIVDSLEAASGADRSKTRVFSGPAGGILLEEKPDSDFALTLVFPAGTRGSEPGRFALFELPSADHFRRQLFPGSGDAEPPAADIPLYPGSDCRTQVGLGTDYFIGFYLTPDSIEAVRSYYVMALTQLGWQRVADGGGGQEAGVLPQEQPRGGRTGPARPRLETFAKPAEDRMVVVQLREQAAGLTRIGMVAMSSGNTGAARIPRTDRSKRR